jgi:hypothetical protein
MPFAVIPDTVPDQYVPAGTDCVAKLNREAGTPLPVAEADDTDPVPVVGIPAWLPPPQPANAAANRQYRNRRSVLSVIVLTVAR